MTQDTWAIIGDDGDDREHHRGARLVPAARFGVTRKDAGDD